MKIAKAALKGLARLAGLEVSRRRSRTYPPDYTAEEKAIIEAVLPHTMTSVERVHGLIRAVSHVVESGVSGALVECGVWRGGSSMAIAKALLGLGARDRDLYLYDTFAGMVEPGSIDVAFNGSSASQKFQGLKVADGGSQWCRATLDLVQANMGQTGYPASRMHFVQGKVEDTIPATVPEQIALLRLDTDWYESTRHELEHLYPRVARGGVVIIDDYGHWEGARKAVDEYFAKLPQRPFLHRIDYTGRLAIRPDGNNAD